MNIISRKLHELEKNVLPELPEKGNFLFIVMLTVFKVGQSR